MDPRNYAPMIHFFHIQGLIIKYFKDYEIIIYKPVEVISKKFGFPTNNANFVVCAVLAIFLNLGLTLFRNPSARKLYSSTAGTFLLFYSHGSGAVLNIFLIISTYLLMFLLPRNAGAKLMAAWALTLMMSVHLYDHLVESVGWKVGTIIQVNFAKVSIIAWNYYDAGKLDDKAKSHNMTQRERYYAEPFRQKPDLLAYFNYFLFVGSSYAGP